MKRVSVIICAMAMVSVVQTGERKAIDGAGSVKGTVMVQDDEISSRLALKRGSADMVELSLIKYNPSSMCKKMRIEGHRPNIVKPKTESDKPGSPPPAKMTRTWQAGAGTTDWFISSAWSPTGVPTPTCDVIIPAGTYQPTISNGFADSRDLTVDSGAILTIDDTGELSHHGASFTNNGTITGGGIVWDVLIKSNCTFYGSGVYFGGFWVAEGAGQSMTVAPGCTINITGYYIMFTGDSLVNNGTIIGTLDNFAEIMLATTATLSGTGKFECDLQIYGRKALRDLAPTITLGSDITVNGSFDLEGGILLLFYPLTFTFTSILSLNGFTLSCGDMIISEWGTLNQQGGDITSSGDWFMEGTFNETLGDTVRLTGSNKVIHGNRTFFPNLHFTNNSSYTDSLGSVVHGGLTIDANCTLRLCESATNALEIDSSIVVGGKLLLSSSGSVVSTTGNVEIEDGGAMEMGAGDTLRLSDTLSVRPGGRLKAVGTAGSKATINALSGNYRFVVDSAGTIETKHSLFSGMGTDGIFIKREAIVTAFDSLTLRGGIINEPLLRIENLGRTFTRIEFDSAGLATYNVKTTIDAQGSVDGSYLFDDWSGTLGGEQYDSDPGDSPSNQGWITWGVPMSVELVYFSATSGYEDVTLVWESSSETGSIRWLIERAEAEDGDYENIVELRGLGTSPSGTTYTYIDEGLMGGITYWYRLTNIGETGEEIVGITSAIPKSAEIISFEITSYPNPFMNNTVIRFEVPGRKDKGEVPVFIIVYDIAGRVVKRLSDGEMAPDYYTINWDGRDSRGRIVGSGIYFLRFDTEDQRKTLKLIRVRR